MLRVINPSPSHAYPHHGAAEACVFFYNYLEEKHSTVREGRTTTKHPPPGKRGENKVTPNTPRVNSMTAIYLRLLLVREGKNVKGYQPLTKPRVPPPRCC